MLAINASTSMAAMVGSASLGPMPLAASVGLFAAAPGGMYPSAKAEWDRSILSQSPTSNSVNEVTPARSH